MGLGYGGRGEQISLVGLLLLPIISCLHSCGGSERDPMFLLAKSRFEGHPETISLQSQQALRQWPTRIKATSTKITADLGGAPENDPKMRQMDMAAPFILCTLIRRYPSRQPLAAGHSVESFELSWQGHSLNAGTGVDCSLVYNRKDQTLYRTNVAFGIGHGTSFKGVTDKLLLQLEKEATQSQPTNINLRRLIQLGCKDRMY